MLGLVVIGIPALLMVCARAGLGSPSPLPGIGSADEIRTFFERQLTTTEIVPIAVRALLIVAWLLWAGLVSSVVVALLQAKGHRAVGLPRLAMFSGLARWIAAGLAAAATLTPSVAVGAPTVRAPAYSLVANHALPTGTRSVPAAPRPVASGFARVQAGESLEMFAERTLGDAGRWTELWDLNQHRVVGEQGERWVAPWKVSAGWDLRLPARRRARGGEDLVGRGRRRARRRRRRQLLGDRRVAAPAGRDARCGARLHQRADRSQRVAAGLRRPTSAPSG